ncbi:unnamed protein product [Microthlaspi erraticum]|uniref:Uncharacterized protein n=1 Tax=Microthlaspi erraticum TaxID=1685480 RepID=A0A6D2K2V3_9BRAS|nr:unnamed protein product [Microthlaspi erraticum]
MEAENEGEMEGYRSEDIPEIENMAIQTADPVVPADLVVPAVVPAEVSVRPEREALGGERAPSLDQSTPVRRLRDERTPSSKALIRLRHVYMRCLEN